MDLVVVRTFDNFFQANLLLTRLRSAGIECFLKDEYTVSVDPFLSNAIGGIKLVVRKEDSAEVIQILEQFDRDFRKTAQCPKCGSHDIELVPKRTAANIASAILSWLFSDYAVSADNVYQCQSCKFESKTLPEPFQIQESFTDKEQLN